MTSSQFIDLLTDTEWAVLADFEVILEVQPSLNM